MSLVLQVLSHDKKSYGINQSYYNSTCGDHMSVPNFVALTNRCPDISQNQKCQPHGDTTVKIRVVVVHLKY